MARGHCRASVFLLSARMSRVVSLLLTCGFVLLAHVSQLAMADCECGYTASIGDDKHLFTDLIETDFTRVLDISTNTDWVRQQFNVTTPKDRGFYGETYSIANTYINTNVGSKTTNGAGNDARSAGLDLLVKTIQQDRMVSVSEIDSNRTDIFYGTYRAGMKLTDIPGTCSAFFWYFNDTQEIDMEFLTKDFNSSNSSYPVNLVLQSREAAAKGFDAQGTSGFLTAYLPFDPSVDFHEYRIDLIPGKVIFYADNQVLGQMEGDAVPTSPGHLILAHWSNGNPLWSGGPPTENAITTVSYVKAYFNSSSSQQHKDWSGRCLNVSAPNAVCAIPEVTETNSTAGEFFFSTQSNMTNNQTVSGTDKNSGAMNLSFTVIWSILAAAITVSLGKSTGM